MKKIVLAMVLGVAVGLVGLGYGQFYEPEHLWNRSGEEPNDWFGQYIAGIGDVNGDGCEDFLASNRVEPRPSVGQVLLFYGGSPPDSIPDLILTNPYSYGYYGYFVEKVGDVNGDGGQDFAVMGGYEQDGIDRVFIYFGGALLDTVPDVVLSEVTFEDVFGYTIEGLGDVNGDGYDDVAVQAANYPNFQSYGKVWIYFGGDPMDSIADWEKQGLGHTNQFGVSIAGGGDLNGDGYDDFAVYEWTGWPNEAQTNYYVFFGGATLDTIPDVIIHGEDFYPNIDISDPSALIANLNGDQYSDLVIAACRTCNMIVFHGGNPMDTQIDLILQGFDPNPPGDWTMELSVAGDVNADGFDDIIASQTAAFGYGGLVLVYLGNSWMSGQPDMRWICIGQPWDGCGKSLADCGDVNGDGVDDIMFGSLYGTNAGRIDIWSGSRAFVAHVPEGHPPLIPEQFHLLTPYPNPFNNSLTIPFEVMRGTLRNLSLKIYNVLGQEVGDLTAKARRATMSSTTGRFEVVWEGKDHSGMNAASGIYLIEMQNGSNRQIQKAVLLK